jgi:hypothetical protein
MRHLRLLVIFLLGAVVGGSFVYVLLSESSPETVTTAFFESFEKSCTSLSLKELNYQVSDGYDKIAASLFFCECVSDGIRENVNFQDSQYKFPEMTGFFFKKYLDTQEGLGLISDCKRKFEHKGGM